MGASFFTLWNSVIASERRPCVRVRGRARLACVPVRVRVGSSYASVTVRNCMTCNG